MRRVIRLTGIILTFLMLCFCIHHVNEYFQESKEAEEGFQEVKIIMEEPEEMDAVSGTDKPVSRKEQYQKLHKENPDFAGWIRIKGTKIDYPVMHTPDRPDFYLKRDFRKEYSSYGIPYIAENCSLERPSDNIIIYGHHMNDGSMFAGLMEYGKKSFYESHKVMQLDTLEESSYYEVIAVFKTTVYGKKGFPFYEFINAETQEQFDSYISNCKRLSLYETEETAEYGDRLITLVTCEYSKKNGRMVVVAKHLD